MKTPVMETERLILRPMKVADAEEAYTNWTSDPEVAKFMRWECNKSLIETKEWLAAEEAAIEGDQVYNWGFILKATGTLIGSGGLVYKEEQGMYELGYCIMRQYWSQGLTTEAARQIVDFGINALKLTKLYCCHAKDNPASGNVMRKVGFQYQKDCVYTSWNGAKSFAAKEYLLDIKSENFHIRRVVQGDARILAEIQTSSWKAAFRDVLSAQTLEKYTQLPPAVQMYTRLLVSGQGNGYIGEVGGKPHCIAWWDRSREAQMPDYAEIICIHSLPDNWRKGYGSRMMDKLLTDILAAGYQKVMLWVFTDNHRARAFYEAKGFAATDSVKPAMGTTEICYIKSL